MKGQEIFRFVNRAAFAVAFVIAMWTQAEGAEIITAKSLSPDDVGSAISRARDGEIVALPAGTVTWNRGLTINEKAITIQGAGSDKTIIVDEMANRKVPMIDITFTKTTGMFRLTGIQFKGGTINTGENPFGILRIHGSNNVTGNSRWRIDHCFFNRPYAKVAFVYAWSGLIDNCVIDSPGVGGLITFDGRIPNVTNHGHRSWATPVAWGTVDAGVYVENCVCSNTILRAITDGYAGARYVVRYNAFTNLSVQNHGTESAQVYRGTRSMEVYNNTFTTATLGSHAVLFRSGTGVVFNNSVSGEYPGLMRMVAYRSVDKFRPYGQANGVNVWDKNDPVLYASGVHIGPAGATILTTTADWQPNQWIGYHVINTATGKAGKVISSTANTVTTAGASWGGQPIWNPGEKFEIRRVIKALDQPGAGAGALLSGAGDGPATPVGWPRQTDEPIYYWNNTGLTDVASGEYFIKSGRDYKNEAKPGYKPLIYPHPWTASDLPVGARNTAGH